MDKFDDVFKILKKYIFEIDETNNDYLCIICKNILSNAHSGPCGCRYCYDCISKLLNSKETVCPGDTNECKQEKLTLNKNIHYEPSVNMRISKLIVKCPEKYCQFKDEIRNIENHIRVCNFRQINCPYFNIGCKQSNLINDDMKNHILCDIVPHSNLLLELIENMRNEMELLKKDIGELKDENKSLKDEIETIKFDRKGNQIVICELERKEKINNDEIVELNEEMVMLKNDNRYLKDEIERMKIDKTNENKENTTATMKMKTEQQTVEIDEIKIKLEMMENKQNEFMNKFDEISSGNAQLMRKSDEIDEIKIKLEMMENKQNEFMNKFDKISTGNVRLRKKSNEIDVMIRNPINTEINDLQTKILEVREFEWKIDGFSELDISNQIYSQQFYAFPNLYQMCLSIIILRNSSGYILHVYLHLMRGKFDNHLSWPCKCDVSIDLINQNNNNQIYRTVTVKYNDRSRDSLWNKPRNDQNDGILFLSKSSSHIENILKNDQLLIKCRTSTPQ